MNCGICKPRHAVIAQTIQQQLSRCHTRVSKWQLFNAMATNGRLNINGIECVVSAVQREDGSGSSFNLQVHAQGQQITCYCRTID